MRVQRLENNFIVLKEKKDNKANIATFIYTASVFYLICTVFKIIDPLLILCFQCVVVGMSATFNQTGYSTSGNSGNHGAETG